MQRPNYYRPKKAPPFVLEEWELDMYRQTLAAGQWHDTAFLFPRVGHLVPAPVVAMLCKSGRKKEPMDINDVELTEETKELLTTRAKAGCVSCGYIMDDWKAHNKLTDYGNFPAEAKIEHIGAEKRGEV